MTSRRQFIRIAACSGAALAAGHAVAQAPGPVLDEKDPQAVALGYVVDAAKVNKAKFPSYVAGQVCGNCQLYLAQPPTAPMGPCPIFANKQVAFKGWCSAYVKKA